MDDVLELYLELKDLDIDIINDIIKQKEIDGIDIKKLNIVKDILDSRINYSGYNNHKEMDGYYLKGIIKDIKGIDDTNIIDNVDSIENPNIKLDQEYMIHNMIKYRDIFLNILEDIPVDRIYKMLFVFKTYFVDNMGEYKTEYRSQAGFLVYNGCNINALLYKFGNCYYTYADKYNVGDILDCYIWCKD